MNLEAVDVCIVEDDPSQRALLLRCLMDEQYRVIQAQDGLDAIFQIRQQRPRVVICDLHMPQASAVEVCRQVRGDPSLDGTYIIVITADVSREARHAALNAGADDLVEKPFDAEEMLARIRNGLRIHGLQERLRRAALSDSLTGLWNHSHFRTLLDREYARTRRYGGAVSLLMLDLDYFKAVNDTFGHECGNRVLQATARHLLASVRDIDLVARYGGEEFAIICPQTGLSDALLLAERIRESLPHAVKVNDKSPIPITASIGVVCTTDPRVNSVTDLINYADQALYLSKRRGRNQVYSCVDLVDGEPEPELEVGEVERLRKQVVALSMQAKELCLQSVWALVQALEARDPNTAHHSRNVTYYIKRMVQNVNWPEPICTSIANAAMLHDLGKIGIPDRILQKSEPLTQSEANTMRQVPLITCKILEPLRVFETETAIIRHLRERYDGTGYPAGLAGNAIPLGSRLLAIAEAFDAMTTGRTYRPPRDIDEVFAEIQRSSGSHFDPQFVELLRRSYDQQQEEWRAQIERARAEAQLLAPVRA